MKKLILLAALVVAAPALGATTARNAMVKDAPIYVTDRGADATFATDSTTAIQGAADASLWIHFPCGHYKTTAAIKLRSFAKVTAAGPCVTIENNRSPLHYESAIFALGNIGRFEMNDLTYKGITSPAAGDTTITFTVPGDSAGFAAGDFVFVRGGSTYNEGGEDFYEFGTINRVESVGVGTLVLKYAIDEATTSASIGNITQSGLTSPVTGDALFATEGVVIDDISVKVASGAPVIREGGGVLSATINLRDVEATNVAYGNAWAHSTWNVDTARFERVLWEFGVNSHHVTTNVRYAKITTASVVNQRPIRTAENGRSLRLVAGEVDLGAYNISDVPIYISNSRDCSIEIGHLNAPNVPTRLATFSSLAQTPTAPPLARNRLSIKKGVGGASQRYVTFLDDAGTAVDNVLADSNFYGAVSQGAFQLAGTRPRIERVRAESGDLDFYSTPVAEVVVDSTIPGGLVTSDMLAARARGVYRNVLDSSVLAAVGQNKWQGFSEITSTSSSNAFQAQTFPAGSLKTGDVLRYEMSGEVVTAGATTKAIEMWIGGTKVVDLQYGSSATGDWRVAGELQIVADNTVNWSFGTIVAGGTTALPSSGGATVSSLAANPLTVEVRGYKGGAGGSLFVRHARAWVERFGQ